MFLYLFFLLAFRSRAIQGEDAPTAHSPWRGRRLPCLPRRWRCGQWGFHLCDAFHSRGIHLHRHGLGHPGAVGGVVIRPIHQGDIGPAPRRFHDGRHLVVRVIQMIDLDKLNDFSREVPSINEQNYRKSVVIYLFFDKALSVSR